MSFSSLIGRAVFFWPLTRSLVVVGCEKCVVSFIALLCVGLLWRKEIS